MSDELTYRTKLWKRSQTSWGTTVPRELLSVRGVPIEGDDRVEAVWKIDSSTGDIVVRFETIDDEGGDADEDE